MVLTTPGTKQSKLTHYLNQKLMSYQVSEKEATYGKRKVCQDEAIVESFLAELPAILASLESISERKDFRK